MNAVSLVERGEMRFICAENEAAKKWKGENGEVWSLIWHSLRFLSLRPSLIQSTLVWYLTSPPAVGNDTSRRRPESGLPKQPKGKKGGAGSSPPAWQLPHQQAGMKLDPDTKSLYEPWDSGHLQWAECRLSLRRASSGWKGILVLMWRKGYEHCLGFWILLRNRIKHKQEMPPISPGNSSLGRGVRPSFPLLTVQTFSGDTLQLLWGDGGPMTALGHQGQCNRPEQLQEPPPQFSLLQQQPGESFSS